MKSLHNRLDALALLATVLLAAGCWSEPARIGETRLETQGVPLGKAKRVRVEVEMGAGDLKLAGGAAGLLDARFTYNVADWKPRVDYTVSGGEGSLRIEEPSGTHSTSGGARNDWDLKLNNAVPLELSVKVGAGHSALTLGSLALRQFDLNVGAGESTLDLVGDWRKDCTGVINGGVGHATIRLPRDVGVSVTVHGGLGTVRAPGFGRDGEAYVNQAYGKSSVTLRLEVNGGVGEVDLELVGGTPTA